MKTIKRIFISFNILFFFTQTDAQTIIQGTVVDFDNDPVANATVNVNSKKTLTNSQGKFTIDLSTRLIDSILITVEYVGMKTACIKTTPDKPCFIKMEREYKFLQEVVISSSAFNIVKKAIEQIPQNYGSSTLGLEGVYRSYHLTKDADSIKKYFTTDALLRIDYKNYSNSNFAPSVYILQNKTDNNNFGVKKDTGRWVNGYLIYTADIVNQRPDYFSSTGYKKYIYKNLGKTVIDGRTVYQINFHSKKQDHTDGTLFIDTATYAIKLANINRYHIKKILFREIEKSTQNLIYEVSNNKWYFSSARINTAYLSDSLKFSRITHFKTTKIDTTRDYNKIVKLKKVEEGIQDNVYDIKSSKEDSLRLDSIASVLQEQGFLSQEKLPQKKLFETTNSSSKPKSGTTFLKYLRGNNVSFSYAFLKTSINASSLQTGLGFDKISNFGLMTEYNFKVYKSLYLKYTTGANNIFSNTKSSFWGVGLKYQYSIPERVNPITFTPSITSLFGKLKIDKQKVAKYTSFETSVYISKSLKKNSRFAPFIQIGYVPFFNSKIIHPEKIMLTNTHWGFQFGIQIKL